VRWRWRTHNEALHRLDRGTGVRHRPATALTDTLQSVDPVALALWQVQRERTLASLKRIRAGLPSPRLAIHDPWALRACHPSLLASNARMRWKSLRQREKTCDNANVNSYPHLGLNGDRSVRFSNRVFENFDTLTKFEKQVWQYRFLSSCLFPPFRANLSCPRPAFMPWQLFTHNFKVRCIRLLTIFETSRNCTILKVSQNR